MPATQHLFPSCTSTHPSVFFTVVCLLGILFTTTCLFSYHRRPHTYAHKLGLRSPHAASTAPHPPPSSTTDYATHSATSPTRDDPIDDFPHLTPSASATTDPPSPSPPPGSTILSVSRETAFALSLLLLLYFGEYRALSVVISTVTTVVGVGDSAAMAWYGGSAWKRGAGPIWSAVVLGAWFLGRWACVV